MTVSGIDLDQIFVLRAGVFSCRRAVFKPGKLARFPHLLFYVPDDNRIDIWRVLHARRDIPAFLTAEPDGPSS